MAKATDTFPVFSYLLKWQYEYFGLYLGVHSAFLLLVCLYGGTSLWLAKRLVRKDEYSARFLFVFSLIWMFFHWYKVRDNWQAIPDGLGDQYMLRTYYQPCVYGVLLLTATAAYSSKRLLPAAFCLVLGALIHPTYLISSSLIAAAIVVLPANKVLEITWRQRLLFLSIFIAVIGVYSFWMLGQIGAGDPLIQKEAHTLLAETRIPHHALVSGWDLQKSAIFFGLSLLAAWFARKHLLGQLLFFLLLIVSASLVWTVVYYNPTVAVAAPWRISAVLAPLSWVVLVAVVAKWINREISKERILPFNLFMTVSILGAVIASVWGVVGLLDAYSRKEGEKFYAVSRFIESMHQSGNQYMVPIMEEHIGMEAGVPIYVTWKTHPTKDTEFLEWYQRIEKARNVYESKVSAAEVQGYLNALSVSHIIWPTSNSEFPYSNSGQRLYADEAYSLWDMTNTP
jgi:hypothetical protein